MDGDRPVAVPGEMLLTGPGGRPGGLPRGRRGEDEDGEERPAGAA
jgi:hypothetical protein